MRFRLVVDDVIAEVEADERSVRVDRRSVRPVLARGPRGFVVRIGSRRFSLRSEAGGLVVSGVLRRVAVSDVRDEAGSKVGRPSGWGLVEVRPPMPGRIISVLVAPGAEVRRGQPILVLEAMKMRNEIPAPVAGVVESISAREGQSVTAQDVVAVVRGR